MLVVLTGSECYLHVFVLNASVQVLAYLGDSGLVQHKYALIAVVKQCC